MINESNKHQSPREGGTDGPGIQSVSPVPSASNTSCAPSVSVAGSSVNTAAVISSN